MLNLRLCAATGVLLILAQCIAVVHAAELGDDDHSAHCAVCVAMPSEEEHDTILPSPVDSQGVNYGPEPQSTTLSPARAVLTRAAWPPQTGPPPGC